VWLAVAACALAGATVFVGMRLGWFGSTPPEPVPPIGPTGKPTGQEVEPSGATTGAPTTTAAPSTSASAAPTGSTAPSGSASTASGASAAPSAAPPPEALPPGRGYLFVTSPQLASVYLNGVLSGKTGEQLDVPCGTRNVRLGKLTTDATAVPEWLSAGQPVIVGCRAKTTITIAPGAAPRPRPAPAPRPPAPEPPGGGAEPYP
jgi:hypothetical protein